MQCLCSDDVVYGLEVKNLSVCSDVVIPVIIFNCEFSFLIFTDL